jgi:polysaccharide biosynthesis transport protein
MQQGSGSLGLAEFMAVIARHRWVVGTVLAGTLVATLVVTAFQTPTYDATTTLRVATRPGPGDAVRQDDLAYADRLANTYRSILVSRPVLAQLARRLDTTDVPGISVTLPANTELLRITATDVSPQRAAAAANALGDILESRVAAPKTVRRIEAAVAPTSPSRPNRPLAILLGLTLGAIGGGVAAVVADRRAMSARGPRRLEGAARAHVLAEIPPVTAEPSAMRIFNAGSPQEEAFRDLRASILALDRQSDLGVLMFVSTESGDLTASVTANVAAALSRAGRRVVAIDADLRTPRLHHAFEMGNSHGLTQVLQGTTEIDDALRVSATHGAMVLTAGRGGTSTSGLLGSSAMSLLMAKLANTYDMVLVAAPSLNGITDAQLIAPATDGVILVVSGYGADPQTLGAASRRLDAMGAPVVGVVVASREPPWTPTSDGPFPDITDSWARTGGREP